jgi:hypothetical protein
VPSFYHNGKQSHHSTRHFQKSLLAFYLEAEAFNYKMSRFWAAGSSSESESGTESESEDEQLNQRQAGGKFGATFQESDSGKFEKFGIFKCVLFCYKKI